MSFLNSSLACKQYVRCYGSVCCLVDDSTFVTSVGGVWCFDYGCVLCAKPKTFGEVVKTWIGKL